MCVPLPDLRQNMNTSKSHSSAYAKARMHDQFTKRGWALPSDRQNSPPLVVWYHKGCRKRVLRLYLSPDGWTLIGERFSLTLDEWLDRIGMTREEYDSSVLLGKREVKGHDRVLPLDFNEWPGDKIELGCSDHRIGYVPLELVAEDARKVLRTRRKVTRNIV